MSDAELTNGAHEIAFEAYGVRLAVGADEEEVLERMRRILPPGSQPCSPKTVDVRFSLTRGEFGTYGITQNGKKLGGISKLELDLALEVLDSHLRLYLGRTAPEAIFVHAGVVSHNGVAIIIPAASFAGKTTLVAALVKAGAIYYSDEFAVVDRDGLVHPYAKALSVRDDGKLLQTDHAVESLGGVAGEEKLRLGLVVITSYKPDAEWNPQRLSQGAGAMALLANAVPARERSEEVMEAISRAVEGSAVIQSDRGEADAVAPLLLRELERHTA
jgi:hypothetical protein